MTKRKDQTAEEHNAACRARYARLTPEKRVRIKARLQRYHRSEKGKAAQCRRNERDKEPERRAAHYARNARYDKSPKGQATKKAYFAKPEARAKRALRLAASQYRRRGIGYILHETIARVRRTRVCHYCGVGIEDTPGRKTHPCKTTIDHKMPLARGGTNEESNLVAACRQCNNCKGRRTAEEFMARAR